MEAMRKEIARLNKIIGKGCLSGKAQVSGKKAIDSKVPQFKQGRHPSIKHGLRHTAGAKIKERKIKMAMSVSSLRGRAKLIQIGLHRQR
jgi:hypothetical protein